MWALVTGASSGIGRDFARILSKQGYDIILVARDEEKLQNVAKELETKAEVISLDLADTRKMRRIIWKSKRQKCRITYK